jgi:predicted small lipoprotein YifL
MKRVISMLMVFGFLISIGACGKDGNNPAAPPDPDGARTEAQAGDQALANGDFQDANTHYRNALAMDPANPQANVGVAVTEIYLLRSDPDVAGVIDNFGALAPPQPGLESERAARDRRLTVRLGAAAGRSYDPLSNGRMVGRILLEGVNDPPTLSRIQQIIKLKVMPKLTYAEQRLSVVETYPDFVYRIPPAVTGEPDTLEMDLGEIYALDAILNSVHGWLGVLVAYNFDTPYEGVKADSLLAPGTAFGTLHPDGAAQLSIARGRFLQSKLQLDAMIAFINTETDDQSDDVIPQSALTEPGFVEFLDGFNQAHASLTQSIDVEVQDHSGGPMTIHLLLKNFFTSPIEDWKTKLPEHTFDVNHEPVLAEPITFPDPTFNGIFPDMTNADWQQLIGPVSAGLLPAM